MKTETRTQAKTNSEMAAKRKRIKNYAEKKLPWLAQSGEADVGLAKMSEEEDLISSNLRGGSAWKTETCRRSRRK